MCVHGYDVLLDSEESCRGVEALGTSQLRSSVGPADVVAQLVFRAVGFGALYATERFGIGMFDLLMMD